MQIYSFLLVTRCTNVAFVIDDAALAFSECEEKEVIPMSVSAGKIKLGVLNWWNWALMVFFFFCGCRNSRTDASWEQRWKSLINNLGEDLCQK